MISDILSSFVGRAITPRLLKEIEYRVVDYLMGCGVRGQLEVKAEGNEVFLTPLDEPTRSAFEIGGY